MAAHQQAATLDVPFSPAIVFFEALRVLDPQHESFQADRLQAAYLTMSPGDAKSDLDEMLSAAMDRASSQERVVRPFDLLLAAAETARPAIESCLATLGETVEAVVDRLELKSDAEMSDESRPAVQPGTPRYAVVAQGPDFYDAGNTYATFEEAQIGCASLRFRAFGEAIPPRPATKGYTWVFPPPRIREATAVYIREL